MMFSKIIKHESGYALPYLLVVFLLVTTLLVLTINFFYAYNKYEIRKQNKKKLDLACYSAVQQFIAKEKPDLSEQQIFIIDSTEVLLGSTHKGFYYRVTAKAKNKTDSSCVTYLLADLIQEPFDNAVVISRPGLNAVVAGKTKIGYLTSSGVNNMHEKLFAVVLIIALKTVLLAQVNENYFNKQEKSDTLLNKPTDGIHCLDRLYFLEKRKAFIGDIYSGLTIWFYENNSSENLIKWRSNESTSHIAISQDEQNMVVTSYIGKKSDLSPIIGCYNFLQKGWLWKFDLKEYLGGTYIRKIFFLENTDLLIVLLRDDICYLDVPTGKIVKRNVSIVGEYENRGEVVISYLRTSRSGRYFAIWNQFTGGGMLPAWFYSKGKKYVTVWDVVEDREVVRFDKPGEKIDDIAFSDDEENLVITSYDNKIKLWSITENKLLIEQDGSAPFIRTSKNKIVLSDGKSICVLKYPSFEIEKSFGVLEISRTPKEYPIAISTVGDLLAFEKDARIHLYDTKRWSEIYNVWACPKNVIEH